MMKELFFRATRFISSLTRVFIAAIIFLTTTSLFAGSDEAGVVSTDVTPTENPSLEKVNVTCVKSLTIEGIVIPPCPESVKTLGKAVCSILDQVGKKPGAVSSNGIDKLVMPYRQFGDGRSCQIEWRKALSLLLAPVGYCFVEDGETVLLGLEGEVEAKKKSLSQERLSANHIKIVFPVNKTERGIGLREAIRDVASRAGVIITMDDMERADLYDPLKFSPGEFTLLERMMMRLKRWLCIEEPMVKRTLYDTQGELVEWRVVLKEILAPHGYRFAESAGVVRIAKCAEATRWKDAAAACRSVENEDTLSLAEWLVFLFVVAGSFFACVQIKRFALKNALIGRVLRGFFELIAIFSMLLLLLTLYFHVGGIEWGDWPIPDEADLRYRTCDVADEDNALVAFFALTNICTLTREESETLRKEKDFALYYSDPFFRNCAVEEMPEWSAVRSSPASFKRAGEIVADNAEFFRRFRAALSLTGFFDKERIDRSKSDLPDYVSLVRFSQLLGLKAQVAIESCDVETVVSSIEDMHALGQKISDHPFAMVDYMVGNVIRRRVYHKMCDAVAAGRVTDGMIRAFSGILDTADMNVLQNWEKALRGEIANVHMQYFEWIRNATGKSVLQLHDQSEAVNGTGQRLDGFERLFWSWPGYFSFSVHRREKMFRLAEIVRVAVNNGNLSKYFLEGAKDEACKNGIIYRLLPNWLGRRNSFCFILPFVDKFLKEDKMNLLHIRLVLAAEKWRRAHGGANPPSLEALVPEYMAEVPADPWDRTGRPMKYDAELCVVWSIGEKGSYDYRMAAKKMATGTAESNLDKYTWRYAFRIDGKPVGYNEKVKKVK